MRRAPLMSIAVLCCVVIYATAAAKREGAAYVEGPAALSDLGIRGPSDIESVLIEYLSGNRYMLSYKDTPELVTRLYRAVYQLGPFPTRGPAGDWNTMLFTPKSGKSAFLQFDCEPSSEGGPDECHIGGVGQSGMLGQVLDEVKRSPKAAALGASVGKYNVDAVRISLPGKDSATIELPNKEVVALVQKAKTIIDWLDIRCLPAEELWDLTAAQRKYVGVILMLAPPIEVHFYTLPETTEENRMVSGGFIYYTQPKTIWCDEFVVMDYGNYIPPVVMIRDQYSDRYYLFDQLTRRAQERGGVEKYGLPGHPLSDKAYYKSPKLLYYELSKLAQKAYKLGVPRSW